MSEAEAQSKAASFDELRRAAQRLNFSEPLYAFYVPGRIEVLGKHTDYAGGRSLLCCVERGFCVLAAARQDRTVRFADVATGSAAEWHLTPSATALSAHWAIYPCTVTRRVARNFPTAQDGVDVAFSSDLPRASGMSSSSALVTAAFFAIAAANHLRDHQEFRRNLSTAEQLATYLGCVENGSSFSELTGDSGVGTFGGSEDHTAILCCEAGMLSQFSFCPLRFERKIKMPQDLIFVIAASGIAADKTGSAQQHYNRLSLGVLSILNIWNEAAGRRDISLGAAVTSSPTAVDQIRALLRAHQDPSIPADFLIDRFEQFLLESCAIVPQAADAFARSDWNRFASLVEQSQVNAERLLRNQVPQTSFLAHSAKELGATAASAFGAGFGGSVWALVDKEKSHEFMTEWSARFHATFPQNSSATFFSSAAGPPLQAL